MIRRCTAFLPLVFAVFAPLSRAQIDLGPVTVGAGLQTSYDHSQTTGGGPTADQFEVDHLRLYVNGTVTDGIKFMFNTDYDSVSNKIEVLDGVAQFSISPEVNIWAGRFLPPSDRANLYGPFYSNEFKVFTDGVQDGYPSVYQGRDNGVMYWGDFGKKVKMKVGAGAFDGGTVDGRGSVIGAFRVQLDFWDKEDGWYLNGTYYGDKNLLAIGGATQVQAGNTATTVDFLLERKLPSNHGVVTIESEYANYNRLGGYDPTFAKSTGGYGLGSYLFPKAIGGTARYSGKIEILGKYAKAEYTHGILANYDQRTVETDLNYVMKQFKARLMAFYLNTGFNRERPDTWQAGLGLQIQI
jgi:hypothetical protein